MARTVGQGRKSGHAVFAEIGPAFVSRRNCRSPERRRDGSVRPTIMAKPNYQFEKRKREMDKKAKKAEKLRRKDAPATPAAPDAATGSV
jgi:hypothetical protein